MASPQDIGLALSGLSAGLGGQGVQFQQQMNQQRAYDQKQQEAQAAKQKAFEAERKKTFYQDAQISLDLLQGGQPEEAGNIWRFRADALSQMPGADPSESEAMANMFQMGQDGNMEARGKVLQSLNNYVTIGQGRGYLEAPAKEEAYTLNEGGKRFVGDKLIAENTKGSDFAKPIPPAVLKDVPAPVADKMAAAFDAAGGGKDGMKAANEMKVIATEDAKRQQVGGSLASMYKRASPAEMAEIQAAVDSSPSVDAGMKKAGAIRTEQRRLKKAKAFQSRTIDLLTRIVEHPDLSDVVGGIEGGAIGSMFRFDQEESDIIADIEEVESILTSDNLDLMTGVLSESDMKIIRQMASGALNRSRSEKRFIGDTTELRNRLASEMVMTVDDNAGIGDEQIQRVAAKLGITPEQARNQLNANR